MIDNNLSTGRRLLEEKAPAAGFSAEWLASSLKQYCESDDPELLKLCETLTQIQKERSEAGEGGAPESPATSEWLSSMFGKQVEEEAKPEKAIEEPVFDASKPESVWSIYQSTHHGALIEDVAARLSALLSRTPPRIFYWAHTNICLQGRSSCCSRPRRASCRHTSARRASGSLTFLWCTSLARATPTTSRSTPPAAGLIMRHSRQRSVSLRCPASRLSFRSTRP